jgi:hypothetical protein
MIERGFCRLVAFSAVLTTLVGLGGGCGARPVPSAEKRAEERPAETTATAVATANTPPALRGGVSLSGRVGFEGPPPERRAINMTKDPQCIKLHGDQPVLDEDVLVASDGGVKNAFVYVRRGVPEANYPMPDKPATLDQKNCMYHPRVQGIRVGQKLVVSNGDPITHNVRGFPILSRPFNFGQPPGSEPRERVFEGAEAEVEIQCDIHPWMHAYVFVMDHPFFGATGEDGRYTIEGLPPGEYTLQLWHEKFGKQRKTVTVADQPVADVDFTFKR